MGGTSARRPRDKQDTHTNTNQLPPTTHVRALDDTAVRGRGAEAGHVAANHGAQVLCTGQGSHGENQQNDRGAHVLRDRHNRFTGGHKGGEAMGSA